MTSPTSQSGNILSPKAIETSDKLTPVAALASTSLVLASPAIKKIIRCPKQVLIETDHSDLTTYKYYSEFGVSDALGFNNNILPVAKQHFVTVKGAGSIVLKAKIYPDTQEIRKNVTWEADGAKITSPAVKGNPLTASISRQVTKGIKIPVRIKVGKQVCLKFVVWIIWCKLTANINSQAESVFFQDETLGLKTGNQARSANQYSPEAGIEWTATIHPIEIVSDKDRPALYLQHRQSPPGGSALDKGVAGHPKNLDWGNVGFTGWDMSRQLCLKVIKGNETNSDHPVTEVTDFDNDPIDAPEIFPFNSVEGNDDKNVSKDENNNPYSKNSLGKLMSTDFPKVRREDNANFNSERQSGKDGDTYWRFINFREFVRVQLGSTWYRCSDYGKWRWHVHMKRLNGKWNADPANKDVLELNNNNFPGLC